MENMHPGPAAPILKSVNILSVQIKSKLHRHCTPSIHDYMACELCRNLT